MPRSQRRAQILSAAAGTFVRAGFDGTSMDDVARAAGVTRLIVYRIFESKYELYTAVLEEVMTDLRERFGPNPFELIGGVDPELVDVTVVSRVVEVARLHPDAFRLLWRHAAHEPEFAELAGLFRDVIYGFADWLITPLIDEPMMRRWAARTVTSYVYEGVCLWLDDGAPQRDEEFSATLSTGARALVWSWSVPGVQPAPPARSDQVAPPLRS